MMPAAAFAIMLRITLSPNGWMFADVLIFKYINHIRVYQRHQRNQVSGANGR